MLLTQTNLQNLRTGLSRAFGLGLQAASTDFAALATIVPSATSTNTYAWLAAMPQWRKFVGERFFKSFAEALYVLLNEPWEKSAELPIDQIEDDNLGIWTNIVQAWGASGSSELIEIQIAAAIVAATTAVGYDGVAFFSTNHPVGDQGAVFSNRSGDASGNAWYLLALNQDIKPFIYQERKKPEFNMVTDPNDSYVFKNRRVPMGSFARGVAGYTFPHYAHRCDGALSAANYEAAYKAMSSLTDDEGRPLGIKPTHILHGASNRGAAKTLFEAQNKAGGESNIYFKDVTIIDGSTRLA